MRSRGSAVRVHFSPSSFSVGTERFHSLWRLKLSATRRWPASILWGDCICLASRASFCIPSSRLNCYGRGSAVQQSDGSVSTPRTPTDPPRTTGKYLPLQQCQVQLLKITTFLFVCLLESSGSATTSTENEMVAFFFLVFMHVYRDFTIIPWSRFVLHLLTNPLTCTWAMRSYIADVWHQ